MGAAVEHGRAMKETLARLLKQIPSLAQLLEERNRAVGVLATPIKAAKVGMKDMSDIPQGHT